MSETLPPGGEVGLIAGDDEAETRGRRIVARLRGRGDESMTTDEIMALTRAD